jgi:hypothetical protein
MLLANVESLPPVLIFRHGGLAAGHRCHRLNLLRKCVIAGILAALVRRCFSCSLFPLPLVRRDAQWPKSTAH